LNQEIGNTGEALVNIGVFHFRIAAQARNQQRDACQLLAQTVVYFGGELLRLFHRSALRALIYLALATQR
jgi:hypothetical protein